jgi:hypothetical protein
MTYKASPAQIILGCLVLVSLVYWIHTGLTDPTLTRTQKIIRIFGGGLWAAFLAAGLLLQLLR